MQRTKFWCGWAGKYASLCFLAFVLLGALAEIIKRWS